MKSFKQKSETKEKTIVHHVANKETITMSGRTCHYCDKISYDDCYYCGKAACKSHGKMFGDNFYCKEHYDRA